MGACPPTNDESSDSGRPLGHSAKRCDVLLLPPSSCLPKLIFMGFDSQRAGGIEWPQFVIREVVAKIAYQNEEEQKNAIGYR